MTVLKVIGIILLIFILIGFLRVGVLMQFGDELRVQLSVGRSASRCCQQRKRKKRRKKRQRRRNQSQREKR